MLANLLDEQALQDIVQGQKGLDALAPKGSVSPDIATLDLQAMSAKVVELCKAQKPKQALEHAVQFSLAAVAALGTRHKTYINSLATIAALMDKLGAQEEAADLLAQAEQLQAELVEEAESELLGDVAKANRDPMDTPERPRTPEAVAGSIPEGTAAEALGTVRAAGRGEMVNVAMDEDESEEEDFFHEDEYISQLTFEVTTLIHEGLHEQAATLLQECEKELIERPGGCSATSRAACQTLWAALLDEVGERDRAHALYMEALDTLQREEDEDDISEIGEHDLEAVEEAMREAESTEAEVAELESKASEEEPQADPEQGKDEDDGAAGPEDTGLESPSKPNGPKPAKSRPAAKPAKRTGGGFVAPEKPKAKAAPKAKAKAKAKAPPKTTSKPDEVATAVIPIPKKEPRPETLQERLEKAQRTATHYMGMRRFSKGADLLEHAILACVAEDGEFGRLSDTHYSLLLDYSKILRLDNDWQGSIDALVAAEEVLEDRGESQSSRRAHLHVLLGQTFASSEDWGQAKTAYTTARRLFDEIGGKQAQPKEYTEVCLALAQCYVRLKMYDEASLLYMEAAEDEDEGPEEGEGSVAPGDEPQPQADLAGT
mmetsp:Transcript_22875/g.50204  ORF Transcript_22875/g.50204 Transcript_22875/m.50204 type:complete len:603 (-) Transcript_22875:67-1875(-)